MTPDKIHFLTFESLTQIQIPENVLHTHVNTTIASHRNMNVEQGTFTLLVFSINGGEGSECLAFHEHIVEKVALKSDDRFEHVMRWFRTKLSFLVLRAGLMCLRGSRSFNIRNQSGDFRIACAMHVCIA